MAKTLQHRRDTTSNLASVTGAAGEIFIDTTKNTVVVMDGSTAGGHPLALEGAGGGAPALDANQSFLVGSCNTSMTGDYNIAIGRYPFFNNTTGRNNIALGYCSLGFNTTGCHNIGLGGFTGRCNSTGSHNVNIGYWAGKCVSGSENISIGKGALVGGSIATYGNISIGKYSQHYSCGGDNVALGTKSLYSNTSGYSAVAIGYGALRDNTTGYKNVSIGMNAGSTNTTGHYNTFIGVEAAGDAATCSNQIVIKAGCNTLKVSSSGSLTLNGSAVGGGGAPTLDAHNSLFIGSTNTSVTGTRNLVIGQNAGNNMACASGTIALGYASQKYNCTGVYNVSIGAEALKCANGPWNVAIGQSALLKLNTGIRNVGIGLCTLYRSTSGNDNVAIGAFSMYATGTGNCNNVALGYCSLYQTAGNCNVGIGCKAGVTNTSGSNNVFLGTGADGLAAGCSNTITLGNSSIATIRAQVTSITALSDARDKTDISSVSYGLNFLKQVRPVTFTWNMRDGAKVGQKEAGFIAQELKEAADNSLLKDYLDGLVISNEDGSRLEAAPNKLFPLVIKAIQELDARLTALENK